MPKQTPETDPTVYLNKPATDLQERFGDWIQEVVGYDPTSAKTKLEAFQAGVRLATATRMVFQASPENREATAAKKAERAEAREEAPAKPAKATKAAPAKAAKAKASKAVVEEDDEEEAPAPKKSVKKATPAKKRRAAQADDDEAPF